MGRSLFTSESVSMGHPDKIADQISDAVLDACLEQDPHSKVACEVLVSTGLVVLAGEITTSAIIDYQSLVRQTIKTIGYDDSQLGFDYRSCSVLVTLNRQSPDIAQGVKEGQGLFGEQGAGDQGMMFGYACDETKSLMPLPITLAHAITKKLEEKRFSKELPYLRPDAKSQVTVEYDEHTKQPIRVDTVVISTQHSEDLLRETLVQDMKKLAQEVIPREFLDADTRFLINPTGRFVIGGPAGDCGLTGRKTTVDTYGGSARHGGGAFSGKDPSKVDRSAAYAARYLAKNLVACGFAKRCEIQLAYAIGYSQPVSILLDTFGTETVKRSYLENALEEIFDLTPKGIIEMLDLTKPVFQKTASGGHFGRDEFTWERCDACEKLQEIVKRYIEQGEKSPLANGSPC